MARDLFGWGASGYNYKYPYMTSTSSNSYYSGSLTDTDYDWGVYHRALGSSPDKITNGGDYSWRLLTSAEKTYIVNKEKYVYTRDWPDTYMQTKLLFCAATLTGVTTNDVKGVIFFPDNWNGDFFRNIRYGNESGVTFSSNVFNAEQWDMLEKLGCVFLPAACVRNGSSMNYINEGRYWTSTVYQWYNEYRGNDLEFSNTGTVNLSETGSYSVRYLGASVRLIYNVE